MWVMNKKGCDTMFTQMEKDLMINYLTRVKEIRLNGLDSQPKINIDSILESWEKGKSEYLLKLFDNSTTFTKNVEIENTTIYEELKEEYTNFFNSHSCIIYQTNRAFTELTKNHHHLITIFGLVNNIVSDTLFQETNRITFDLPNGEKMIIQKGEKLTKFLLKFIGYFSVKDAENFVLEYSKIKNKSTKQNVELTFSIHPMDYLTLSDNENNWTSCLSLLTLGCYCGGVSELLTSKSVIVCYIKNKTSKMFCDSWNSKSGRFVKFWV